MRTIAKYSHDVIYNIKTRLDSSGISKLQSELSRVMSALNQKTQIGKGLIDNKGISQSINNIQRLKNALNTSFNSKTGILDLQKFNQEIGKSGKSLNENLQNYYKDFKNLYNYN